MMEEREDGIRKLNLISDYASVKMGAMADLLYTFTVAPSHGLHLSPGSPGSPFLLLSLGQSPL